MGHPSHDGKATDQQTAHLSDADWQAPRLSKALLLDPAGKLPSARTSVEEADPNGDSPIVLGGNFLAELSRLFDHIHERLEKGLDEAWLGPNGYDYKKRDAADGWLDSGAFPSTPEEKWARAFCERFVFSAYWGSAKAYGYPNESDDRELYKLFDKGILPLVVACQHLSSYGVLTRGVPVADITVIVKEKRGEQTVDVEYTGCGCTGGTVRLPAFVRKKEKGGASAKTTEEANTGKYLRAPDGFSKSEHLVGPGIQITPGSVVVWNPGGFGFSRQDATKVGITHIATVLRVSGTRVQFVDTGPAGGASDGGTADHGFTSGDLVSTTSLVGVGVLRDTSSTLEEYTKKTMEARPLGLARLLILRGEKGATDYSGKVAFASKLLHVRWPVSRLIWSLRNLPTSGLIVVWLVYATYDKGQTDKLVAEPDAPPASFLPPPKESAKGLTLTNAIVSSGEKVEVFRTRNYSQWRRDFSNDKIEIKSGKTAATWAPAGLGDLKVKVGDPRTEQGLLAWCARHENMAKRIFRLFPDGDATADEGRMGHPLVDP